jgi:DNA-binding protein YbaB
MKPSSTVNGVSDVPIGAAEDWVRSWTASVSEKAAAAQSLSDQVARLAVSASDRENMITVTVNGSGGLIDLRLAPEAGRWAMDRLAAEILRTMRRAQASLAERVAAIAEQTVGSDSETARTVVSSFERRFPVERAEDDDQPGGGRSGRTFRDQ